MPTSRRSASRCRRRRCGVANGAPGRALSMRVYAIADARRISGDSWRHGAHRVRCVMPTSCRLSAAAAARTSGCWARMMTPTLKPWTSRLASRLRNASLPSRVGENLYWLGRYATRCEDKIRLLRGTLTLERRSEVWPRAVDTCRHLGVTRRDTDPAGEPVRFEASIRHRGRFAAPAVVGNSGTRTLVVRALARDRRRSAPISRCGGEQQRRAGNTRSIDALLRGSLGPRASTT